MKSMISGVKCFACDKPLKPGKYEQVEVVGDNVSIQWVGPECYRKIKKAGPEGYQPPSGGPKLSDTVGKYTRDEE